MRLPSRRQTFWVLMTLSAASAWLPQRWFAPVKETFATLLAPLSDKLGEAGQAARGRVEELAAKPTDAAAFRELKEQRDRLARELATLRARTGQLERQNADLAELRGQIGPGPRLAPGRVVIREAAPLRDSLEIGVGSNARLERDMRVCTRGRPGQAADGAPSADDRTLGAVLVGKVDSVGRMTARVRLLTDPASKLPVQLYDPAGMRPGPTCTLLGKGTGRLVIERVSNPRARPGERIRNEPPVRPGFVVFTRADDPDMPVLMLVGWVEDVRPRDDNPLEFDCRVKPAADYGSLSLVYVVDARLARADGGRP